MKIFISLYSGIKKSDNKKPAIPCFYETIIKKLEDEGCEVVVYVSENFAKEYDKIPKNLLKEIKNFNPDLFIFFNNTFYDISKDFDCPIVIYEVDSPLFYSNKKFLKSNISRYKFFVSQEESIEVLKNEFGASKKNILKIPFFTEIRAKKCDFQNDIVFIGTKFYSPKKENIYNKFINVNPNLHEIKQYKSAIAEFLKNPFLKKDEIARKINITSNKVLKYLNTNKLIFSLSDLKRIKTLSSLSDMNLKIYGTSNWAKDNYNEPFLILNYDKTPKYSLEDNQNLYNASKIGININHLQARSGFSWRVCDIMASNACLVSEFSSNIKDYFKGVEIPLFSNEYEARQICKKLLENETLRQDIVLKSQEVINKSYRFENIKKEIEPFLNINLKGGEKHIETRYIFERPPFKIFKKLKEII